MVKAQKFILAKHFEGAPQQSNFELVEINLPPLKDRQILTEAVWVSVDPYIRAYTSSMNIGSKIIGSQVAKVLESTHPHFKVNDLVVGPFGWQTVSVVSPDQFLSTPGVIPPYVLPDFGDLSPSLGLGVLGMTGNTAYFGFLEICQPKPGEVVVISGAAGAVGSHVAQIAKQKGCFVIGFAGSDEKVNYLLHNLKIDAAFNYKTSDLPSALHKAASQGVDCYFDNVGGEISSIIMYCMNPKGRVAVCGSISSYNADAKSLPKASIIQPALVMRQLRVEGFLVGQWNDRFMEGIKENYEAIKASKLKYREHVTNGFENLPKGLIEMLEVHTSYLFWQSGEPSIKERTFYIVDKDGLRTDDDVTIETGLRKEISRRRCIGK